MNGRNMADVLPIRDVEICLWPGWSAPPASDSHRIYMMKNRHFLAALETVLDAVAPKRMVEVGIFHGGSTIYWTERYDLRRLVAFDLASDAPALIAYLDRHRLRERVRLHLGVSQDDAAAIRNAVVADFENEMIDVVIDDASHLYEQTWATLEILLPFVRPGGAYIIEDWFWPPIRPLVTELPLLAWQTDDIIDRIEIDKSFLVLWRGSAALPTDGSFSFPDPISGSESPAGPPTTDY